MSTFQREKVRCAVCNEKVEQMHCMSTNSFGYADLDFRPAPQARFTMYMSLKQCPKCGYATPRRIQVISDEKKEIVLSNEYQEILKTIPEQNKNARKAYMCAYIEEKLNKIRNAIEYYKMAAWAFGDANNEMATACRNKAMELMEARSESKMKNYSEYGPVYIDMKRRNGEFEAALEALRTFKLVPFKYMKEWKAYERKLCRAQDKKAHSCEEFIRDIKEEK